MDLNFEEIKERITHANHSARNSTEFLESRNVRKAAVLVAIFDHNNSPYVILTLRSNNLRKHRGQVALPGGKQDDEDAGVVETAMRETEEEIGLNRKNLNVLGILPPSYSMASGVLVYPVIAILSKIDEVQLNINEEEVEDVFAMPLHVFMIKDFHERRNIHIGPRTTIFSNVFTFPRNHSEFGDNDILFLGHSQTHGTDKEFFVFGLTAMICLVSSMIVFDELTLAKFSERQYKDWLDYIIGNGKFNQRIIQYSPVKPKM